MEESHLDPHQIRAVADIMDQMQMDVWGLLIDAEESNELWIQFDAELSVPILHLDELHERLTQIEVDAAERIIWEIDEADVEEADGTFLVVIDAILITEDPERVQMDA